MSHRRRESTLSQALRVRGLPVAALAAETGLSINATRRIVHGDQVPSIATALAIAKFVDTEVEVLFALTVGREEGGYDVDCACRFRRPRGE